MEVNERYVIAIVVVVAVAIGGFYYFTQMRGNPEMPSNMKVMTAKGDSDLKQMIDVSATASPGPETEISEGDSIGCSVDVERIGDFPGEGVAMAFVVSERGTDLDVALLVGKGMVNVTSYVNNLGNGWKKIGKDSRTISSLDNSRSFNLSVTY